MKKQVYNPYLPLHVHIPDGEPHVFGDRVYVYGSHDEEGGSDFCVLDYEVWSAPGERPDRLELPRHGLPRQAGSHLGREARLRHVCLRLRAGQ